MHVHISRWTQLLHHVTVCICYLVTDCICARQCCGVQVYEIHNLHLEGKLCRTNLVPRTIVRGPGFLNAVMIMEQVSSPLGTSDTTHMYSGTICVCMYDHGRK